MNQLARFAKIYRSSQGGKAILRQYTGLEADAIIPLSLSHGVDYGQERLPQDYLATEPLHWCYNTDILARTKSAKPGVLLPHPWLMVRELMSSKCRSGGAGRVLVIGPPPSPLNDESLRDALARARVTADAILVKKRGTSAFQDSIDFWRVQGVEPVSAGLGDDGHYFRLAEILSSFDRVILPVFSSVGVFAAALGCEVMTLTDYWHCSYSPRELDMRQIANSPSAKRFARLFAGGDQAAQRSVASEFLGESLLGTPAELLERFNRSLESITYPVHVPAAHGNALLREVMVALAMFIGRIDFLRYGLGPAIRYKLMGTKDVLICKRVNMIDALLGGGLDHTNFESRSLRPEEAGVRSGEGAVF